MSICGIPQQIIPEPVRTKFFPRRNEREQPICSPYSYDTSIIPKPSTHKEYVFFYSRGVAGAYHQDMGKWTDHYSSIISTPPCSAYSGVSKEREYFYLAPKYPSNKNSDNLTNKKQNKFSLAPRAKGCCCRVGNWPYHSSLVAIEGNTFTDFQLGYLVKRYKCLRYFDTPRYYKFVTPEVLFLDISSIPHFTFLPL